jgi:hypothetical protein
MYGTADCKTKGNNKIPNPKTQMREQIDNAKQGFLTTPYVAGLESVLVPTHDERYYMTQHPPVQNPLETHYLISYGQTEIRDYQGSSNLLCKPSNFHLKLLR